LPEGPLTERDCASVNATTARITTAALAIEALNYNLINLLLSVVFHLLHPLVRDALKERGLTEPTEPQKMAIPEILAGNNVLIIAPTGSGKTEAAMLPILSMMLEQGVESPGIYVLYITPLRALNRDLLDRIRWWGERVGFKVDVRHGDTDKADRQRQSKTPPHILITTPEMLQAIMTGRRLLEHLKALKWVVVDEVHELAEDKRGVQLSLALERLRYHVGRDFQIVGLSATVGSPAEVAQFLVGE
jgi:ATP dependent helicase, Lhr family